MQSLDMPPFHALLYLNLESLPLQILGFHRIILQLPVSYTHLRAHETEADLVCRLLLEKKKEPDISQVPKK